jgi:hypothetical protein
MLVDSGNEQIPGLYVWCCRGTEKCPVCLDRNQAKGPSTSREVVPDLVFELPSLLRANPKAMGLSDAASIMAEKATLSWII